MNELIVIIEDDQGVLEACCDHLSMFGYRVVGLHLRSAHDLVMRNAPDLVLMDLMLDGAQDGIEFTTILRERGVACPIVAFSASNHQMAIARQSGRFDAYIDKPFDIFELKSVIAGLLPTEAERPAHAHPDPNTHPDLRPPI